MSSILSLVSCFFFGGGGGGGTLRAPCIENFMLWGVIKGGGPSFSDISMWLL